MGDVSDSPDTSVVTVLSDRSALEPKVCEDAACVASASTAALRPDRLLLATVALFLLWVVGVVWDAQNGTNIPSAAGDKGEVVMRELLRGLPEEKRPVGWELDDVDGREIQRAFADEPPGTRAMAELYRNRGGFEYLLGSMQEGAAASFKGLLAFDPESTFRGMVAGTIDPIRVLWTKDRYFLVLYGTWSLLVLCLCGGAMCRSDAERIGSDREVPLSTSIRWVLNDWRRLWGAAMLPPVMVVLLLLPVALVLGILSLIPGVDVVIAALWILPLVFGFAAAILLVAWLIGLPLIIPAAAMESGDPGEITVRVATLLRRRPLRAVVLSGTAILSGLLLWMVISMVAVFTLSGTSSALSSIVEPIGPVDLPTWPTLRMESPVVEGDPVEWGATSRMSSSIIDWWNGVVIFVARAWILGFVLLAAGRIYLCLRRAVEKLPFDDLGRPGPLG
ncbi:MAG: hypothetical protein CMJ34_14525 [Phycisphaerae bacterium]|nr:hypothetical protein [Phycisphaerae bacterium]